MKKVILFFTILFVVVSCTKETIIEGTPGPQGEQGIQGNPGQDGQDGADGQDGSDATFPAWAVTSQIKLSGVWTVSDEEGNYIGSFALYPYSIQNELGVVVSQIRDSNTIGFDGGHAFLFDGYEEGNPDITLVTSDETTHNIQGFAEELLLTSINPVIIFTNNDTNVTIRAVKNNL